MTEQVETPQQPTASQQPATPQEPQQTQYAVRPRHHHRRLNYSDHDNMFKLRNIFNLAFMLLAIVGVILWMQMDNHFVPNILLIIGVAFKIAEVSIRMFHK